MPKKAPSTPDAADLRCRAETRLSTKQGRVQQTESSGPNSALDANRLLHELQVHAVELEMQNEELQFCRDRAETLLEKYTDLYDFAPVGYFSLDERGWVLEVNLAGAALLGEERSKLINNPLLRFVRLPNHADFLAFLERVFAGVENQGCEVTLLKVCGTPFWAGLHGLCVKDPSGSGKRCRMTVSDITSRKQADATRHRLEALETSNQELKREIAKRRAVEKTLRSSETRQTQLLQQLRGLSHRVLQVQEEERKRISRELHDEISQILVGINVHLESLARHATINPEELGEKIAFTQKLVEKSIDLVHQFARELRPAALDDLGLSLTLKASFAEFTKRTNIPVSFTACSEVEQLNNDRRTVLYRIVQEALTNVTLHAHANSVKVHISKISDEICLEINDNGKSFKVEHVLQDPKNKRLGLLGMRERAEMVGGTFRIESTPDTGTTIHTQIPFHNNTREQTCT